MIKSIFLFVLFFCVIGASATVWVYPKPGESIISSPFYNVSISQNNEIFESFTYFSQATYGDVERSSSWTTFSFEDKIRIEVEVLGTAIKECVIRPKSNNIQFEIQENKVVFELDKPQKLAIEINGNKKQVLFIFADESEQIIPDKEQKGLWIYEAGIHEIGRIEVPDTVKNIYIAGGAIIKGAFYNSSKVSGFKITGRGIISGEMFEKISPDQQKDTLNWHEKNPHLIELNGNGKNVIIEGITFTDGPMHSLSVKQSYATVLNCKFFAWHNNTDGVECGSFALIEDCFFRCNGDAIKIYENNLVAFNCVFWQNERGSPFQISWNSNIDTHSFRVTDCDIIHCEHYEDDSNQAIFSAVHGGSGNLSGYLFKDIRIEGDVYRLIKLTIRFNMEGGNTEFGSISNLQFKNITLEGKSIMANEIWGYNSEHKISDVGFENLNINGEKIMSAERGNFKLNLNTTSNVFFE